MKIACIAGARPNFMKVAPIIEAMRSYPELHPVLVHTGQHYDDAMSKVFFEDLALPDPDIYLGVGSDTQARQTAKVMVELETWVLQAKPDYVLVVGDVNSTLAASLVASKLRVRLGHVEAGLRSFDRDMPEEINRLVTDTLADDLFTSCADAEPNLAREGVDPKRIHFVGNVMIDSLVRHRAKASASDVVERLGVSARGYTLVTLHRPSNVDEPEVFKGILSALGQLSDIKPVLFPVHPRTRKRIGEFGLEGLMTSHPNLRLIEPVRYLEFLRLMDQAALLFTDSGGIQEETTFLGVPCITVRHNTERPITITEGTNELVGTDPGRLVEAGKRALSGSWKKGKIPALWDGKSGQRIAAILDDFRKGTA